MIVEPHILVDGCKYVPFEYASTLAARLAFYENSGGYCCHIGHVNLAERLVQYEKSLALTEAECRKVGARLAEAERLLLRWHRAYIEDAVGAGGLECADDDTTTFLMFHAERATSSATGVQK